MTPGAAVIIELIDVDPVEAHAGYALQMVLPFRNGAGQQREEVVNPRSRGHSVTSSSIFYSRAWRLMFSTRSRPEEDLTLSITRLLGGAAGIFDRSIRRFCSGPS